jgi:hypothetical protein
MTAPSQPGYGGKVRIFATSPRFILRAADYTWHDRSGKAKPGVGIFVDRTLVQHLTADEAIALADQLVDAAEAGTP